MSAALAELPVGPAPARGPALGPAIKNRRPCGVRRPYIVAIPDGEAEDALLGGRFAGAVRARNFGVQELAERLVAESSPPRFQD